MKVKVKLFATFREGRFMEEIRDYPPSTTVVGAISEIGIGGKVAIIFVNGRHAPPDQILRDGDTLALFPPTGGG